MPDTPISDAAVRAWWTNESINDAVRDAMLVEMEKKIALDLNTKTQAMVGSCVRYR